MNEIIRWITDHEESLRSVNSAEELAELLRENGFEVDAGQLQALADEIGTAGLGDDALENVAGGVFVGASRDGVRILADLLYRPWESAARPQDLVYRGQPVQAVTLEERTGRKETPLGKPSVRSL